MKKIFIIILNYNGLEDTRKCLATLHILEDRSYRIDTVIVDNGSNTEELAKLKKLLGKYPKIRLLQNRKNLGFAAGNNVGIKYALKKGADYVFLLNNDTKIEMNFFTKLLKINAPISSPLVRYREFKEYPRLIYDLGGTVNWWTGRTDHINVYDKEYKKLDDKSPKSVDYVAGCSMLVKREVFEKIGFLDEKYFIYFEDVDFCVTAKKNGFNTVIDRNSYIWHRLGGSMDRWSRRAIFHNLIGNLIFITKHLGLRRITGYAYLFALAGKIIWDKIIGKIKNQIAKNI